MLDSPRHGITAAHNTRDDYLISHVPAQTSYQLEMRICYYELLGVDANVTDDELKKAYRKRALEWHPDKNHHRVEEATRRFAHIQEAYEVLSDPHERAWYVSERL
jgi:DnaJ-class molecular chaperone